VAKTETIAAAWSAEGGGEDGGTEASNGTAASVGRAWVVLLV